MFLKLLISATVAAAAAVPYDLNPFSLPVYSGSSFSFPPMSTSTSTSATASSSLTEGATVTAIPSGKPDFITIPMSYEQDYWVGKFGVGLSSNLSLVIVLNSTDIFLNPRHNSSNDYQEIGDTGQHIPLLLGSQTQAMDIAYTAYSDFVSVRNQKVCCQTLGVLANKASTNSSTEYPNDGYIGFSPKSLTGMTDKFGGTPFLSNLCGQGKVETCRFGIACGSTGVGSLILGGVDASLKDEELVYTSPEKSKDQSEWAAYGNITAGGEAKLMEKDLYFETFEANIVGPYEDVLQIFSELGIDAVSYWAPTTGMIVFGLYNCTMRPQFGFQLASKNAIDVEDSAFQQTRYENGTCKSSIIGSTDRSIWIVGQPWFQGKYVEFDLVGRNMSIANLKKGAFPEASTTKSSALKTTSSPVTETGKTVAQSSGTGVTALGNAEKTNSESLATISGSSDTFTSMVESSSSATVTNTL